MSSCGLGRALPSHRHQRWVWGLFHFFWNDQRNRELRCVCAHTVCAEVGRTEESRGNHGVERKTHQRIENVFWYKSTLEHAWTRGIIRQLLMLNNKNTIVQFHKSHRFISYNDKSYEINIQYNPITKRVWFSDRNLFILLIHVVSEWW